LEMNDCVIGPNNIVTDAGGGLANRYGNVTLNRCTIVDNHGTGSIGGAGLYAADGGSLVLINSTVTGNVTNNFGGGIYVGYEGTVNLIHSTVSGNIANQNFSTEAWGGGGGIYVSNMGEITTQNSIVAGNIDMTVPATAGHAKWPDVYGAFTSLGGDLIGDGTGSTGWVSGDLVGTYEEPIDPILDVLYLNEPGTTETYALLAGSPAIDAVTCPSEITTDQRGVLRPQGDFCDIGAYELRTTDETLTVLPETIPSGEHGIAYTQQFTVSNANGVVTWSWLDGGLEEYCDVNAITGVFMCYTNTPPPVGSYTFTIKAKDENSATGSRRYTLVMNPLLTFDPQKLLMARLNQTYNQAIMVAGGAEPYTLTHLTGDLPDGIIFEEGTDAFTGTPTETGTFNNIVVQVVDANGVTKLTTYTLRVLPEHLFTWTPIQPTSYQSTNFTALLGFDYYGWDYSRKPDGECDDDGFGGNPKTLTFVGKGQHKVCLSLGNNDPIQSITDEQWVTVTNSAPTIDSIDVDPYIPFPGQEVEASFYFYDVDGPGTFTCQINWGDESGAEAGVYDPVNSVCTFPPHTYAEAGSYTISATVTDDEDASDTESRTYDVVYLYAEAGDTWLASNTLPTTVLLYGYAPLGTESITFDIASAPAPAHGTLGTPSFMDCRPDDSRLAAQCRATVVYTPTPPPSGEDPYVGYDNFDFTVSKLGHKSTPDTVDLYLASDNQPPTATDGAATVLANAPTQFAIFGKDMDGADYNIDRVTFQIVSPPTEGTLHFDEDADIWDWFYDDDWNTIGAEWYQMLTYTPKPGTTALSDSFTFLVNDSHQDSVVATVNLTLHGPDTLHVNNNNDIVDDQGCNTTHCSLREAILGALIGDTIDFTLSLPSTVTLTQGELLVNKSIQIQGPGADQLTVSAGFTDPSLPAEPAEGFRIFHIYNNNWPMEVGISGLTIRDGRGDQGGGVFVDQEATLVMTDCVIGPNNIVSYAGGGISIQNGTLTMNNCSVVGNHGTGSEGGAGIFTGHSELTIVNSTISGNVTNNYGGGVLAKDNSVVTLIHSTVSDNIANQDFEDATRGGGGGIYIDNAALELWNTIIAGNTDLTDPTDLDGHAKWPDVSGAVTSLGGNLIGDGTGSTGWLGGDMVGSAATVIDPLLGTLDIHEPGVTPTFPLLAGSPAIDAVACATGIITDQRGITRPQGSACDIGAFELEPGFNQPPSFTSTPLTTATQGLLYSYTVTASDQNAGDSLTITAPIKPAWLTFLDNGDGTATLSGTPTLPNVGNHPVKLVVTDSMAANSVQEFTIVVQVPISYKIFLPMIRR
jgi:hypothetical protein